MDVKIVHSVGCAVPNQGNLAPVQPGMIDIVDATNLVAFGDVSANLQALVDTDNRALGTVHSPFDANLN